MKKELNVIGLDCGHCALTLEKYLEKVDGVKSCNINISTSKIFIETDEDKFKTVFKNIVRTAKQVNPDVKITETKETGSSFKLYDIILYVIGLIMGVVALFTADYPVLYWIMLVVSALCMGYRTYWKAILQLKRFKIN